MAPPISFLFAVVVTTLIGGAIANDHPSIEFSYSGSKGPDKWGSLDPQFSACSSGKSQSPIDILKDEAVVDKNLKPLQCNYASEVNATLVNNGINVGVTFPENAGVLTIDGKNFNLKQMHWHSPSEHRINGEQFAAELHMVHKTAEGSVAVVGILFQLGDEDPLVSKMDAKLKELAKEVCAGDEEAHITLGKLETREMRKKSRKYYRYGGSLTTPPCTEPVIWTILGKVRSISKEQVDTLKAPLDIAFQSNARPAQPLNGRKVQLFDEMGDA